MPLVTLSVHPYVRILSPFLDWEEMAGIPTFSLKDFQHGKSGFDGAIRGIQHKERGHSRNK